MKAELLVDLGLAFEDKAKQHEVRQQMEELFKPVLKIKNVLHEIEISFLRARGLSIKDLPALVANHNEQYDAVTKKMDDLEASRKKLIERFRKTSEQRKLVTIDKIVAKFAETNTYLENKLQEKQ
jgi:DNA-binding transcriptional MerR regulator